MNNLQAPSKLVLKNSGGKIDASTAERIALLISMNLRHKMALNQANKKQLQKLAREYEAHGCPRLAQMIRIEARSLRAVKS